jgi:hypothetical protein
LLQQQAKAKAAARAEQRGLARQQLPQLPATQSPPLQLAGVGQAAAIAPPGQQQIGMGLPVAGMHSVQQVQAQQQQQQQQQAMRLCALLAQALKRE